MRILSVIQPSELGSDFRLEDGVWKVNFPSTGGGTGNELSADENNALTVGTDGGLFLSQDLLNAYAMVQDNQSQKIHLYRFPAGSVFSIETATLVSSVSLIEMTGIFDDVAIEGDVITFTDADTGLTLTLDTANLQRVDALVGSETVEVMSVNGTTTLSVKIDPRPDNAIQVTEEGLLVTGGGEVGDVNLLQTLAVVEDGLCHAVGNSHLVMPQIELVDVAGNPIGYLTDMARLPVSSITADGDHCTHWTPPMTSANCRIGKVGVALIEDLPYGDGIEETIEWQVHFNGQLTNYIVSAGVEGTNGGDFIKGYLEDIISDATSGAVQGAYNNELSLWNTSTEQAIIKLVPSVPITLERLQQMFNGDGLRIFGLNAEQASFISKGQSRPPEVTPPELENLEDYYSAEDSSLTICLAPNVASGGGSQISCADATDRFATSGLWNTWTLKIDGNTVVQAVHSNEIIQALENAGVKVRYEGEMQTFFRNVTDKNIRIELIAHQQDQWDINGLEIVTSTNPTLMGYDPIQMNAPAMAMALVEVVNDEPIRYTRITVCLAPASPYMEWEYRELDTSTALVTLTNSIKLVDVSQDFTLPEGSRVGVETGTDTWGDYTWTLSASEPGLTNVSCIINSPEYSDNYNPEFLARQPMILTLVNVHDYYRSVTVESTLEEPTTIASIEVFGKNGSTLVVSPEDGMVIDAAFGALRIDNLETAEFSYIVQGRFVDSELSDNIKVKFVTDLGVEEIVEVSLTTNSNIGFQPVNPNMISHVTVGVVDNNRYSEINMLPAINIEAPEWDSATLDRVNGVGGQHTMSFTFNAPASMFELHIKAFVNGARLAVIGDCVIGVDQWGETEAGAITFNRETFNSRFDESMDFSNVSKNNLSYVPAESPSNMQDMTGMFAGTDLSYPDVDLSAYNVGMVYSMAGVFARSNFNGNIMGWKTRYINNMDYAFYDSKYRQDLSLWCVSSIGQEPKLFSYRAPLLSRHKPVWGTCPLEGNNSNEWGEVLLYNAGGYAHNYRSFGLANDFITDVKPEFTAEGLITELRTYTPIRYLGARALKDQAITKVQLVDGLKLIDTEALAGNMLVDVTIPSTVSVIGDYAFAGNPLTNVIAMSDTPPELGLDVFPASVAKVIVDDAVMSKYAAHKAWKQFAAILAPMSTSPGVSYIDYYTKTKKFIAGEVITDSALENSQALILNINEGVTTLENDALFGTTAHYLKVPGSLTTIGNAALNLSADILEFSEGFTSNEFMLSSRPGASTLILPSTTTALNGIFVAGMPSVIVCKALVPPTLEVTQYTHPFNKYITLSRAVVVPAESIAAYQADPNWNALTNNFVALEDFDYGNVREVSRIDNGSNGILVQGKAAPTDIGKEVTIVYSDYRYDGNLGVNVRSEITYHTATVNADGSFELTIPRNDTFATQYVTVYIGEGNEKIANW